MDARLEKLYVGQEYESICFEGDWWKVKVKSKNPNGSYVASVVGCGETEWTEVWAGNCRLCQSESELDEAAENPAQAAESFSVADGVMAGNNAADERPVLNPVCKVDWEALPQNTYDGNAWLVM